MLCRFTVQVFQETEVIKLYSSFTQKITLKRPFISGTQEESAVHCLGVLGYKALILRDVLEMVGALSGDTVGKD